jgi:hypothetical protein
MTPKRYQVFVSSTYRDLKHERAHILRALAEASYIAAGMEYFPAIDQEQFNFIKTIIDDSDYFVVIIAGMYGSLAADGLSYSEKEYEYALQKSLPIIALLHEDITSLNVSARESNLDKIEKLDNFRHRLSEGRMVSYWQDETQLCYRMLSSLAMTARTYPRDGWIRGTHDPADLLRRLIELEDLNKQLNAELTTLKEVPLLFHIRDRLSRSAIEVTYKSVEPANGQSQSETSAVYDALEVALFVLPRMGFTSRSSWEQISLEQMRTLVEEFVKTKINRHDIEVDVKTLDRIARIFELHGVVSRMSRWDHQLVMITQSGFDLVTKELDERFKLFDDRKQLRERDVTMASILQDFGIIIKRAAARVRS